MVYHSWFKKYGFVFKNKVKPEAENIRDIICKIASFSRLSQKVELANMSLVTPLVQK